MPTIITYSVSEDTANGKVNGRALEKEVFASPAIPDGVLAYIQVGVGGDPDVIQMTMGRDPTQPEQDALDALVAAHTGAALEAVPQLVHLDGQSDQKNRPYFIPWVTEGSRTTFVSHRWNDPTTWVEDSSPHVEQPCSATSAGTVYQAPHTNLIDVCHGKVWAEEKLNHSHGVTVEVDTGSGWEAKSEKDPHDNAGDFTVDYKMGTITFNPPIDAGASVRASYHVAGSSVFTLAPTPGKQLLIKSAEVQFSEDVEMTDTVIFEAYGFVDVFAPHLVSDTPNYQTSFPSGFKIPLRSTVYKTLHQFIDESNGAYPTIPAIGGNTWRGIQSPITVFPWSYAAALPLSSAAGMEIRVRCVHDTPFLGSYATATFYCLSEDE